jgi:hypothetical protein
MTQRVGTLLSRSLAVAAFVFGMVTLMEGGAVALGDATARAAAGAYVPFVVWFNFMAGFAYVAAAIGLWVRHRWAVWLAVGIALATAAVFVILGAYILAGGPFELRTVFAMALRTLVWTVIAVLAWRT